MLTAIDETNGFVLWQSPIATGYALPSADQSSVYAQYDCGAASYVGLTGAVNWNTVSCSPAVLGDAPAINPSTGLLFDRVSGSLGSSVILNPSNGAFVGAYSSPGIAALSGTKFYYLSSGSLHGADASNPASLVTLWTFAGDGLLNNAPLVLDQTVFVASSSGNVYALNATTGALLWTGNAGASIPGGIEFAGQASALGIGEGYLVVPTATGLTAWHLQ